MPERISRKQLAALILEAMTNYDPYMFGNDEIEIIKSQLPEDLNTLHGCKAIIQELCNMILES